MKILIVIAFLAVLAVGVIVGGIAMALWIHYQFYKNLRW